MRRGHRAPRAWTAVARHAVVPLLLVVIAVALVVGLILVVWGGLASSEFDYRRTLTQAFVTIGIWTAALLALASMRGEHGVLRPLLRRLPFDPSALIRCRLALVLPAAVLALLASLTMESALRPRHVGPLLGESIPAAERPAYQRGSSAARVRLSNGEREVPVLVSHSFLTMASLGGEPTAEVRYPAEWWRREPRQPDPDTLVGTFPMHATIEGRWSMFDLSRLGFAAHDEIHVRFSSYMSQYDLLQRIARERLWAWVTGVVFFLGWTAALVALAAFPRRSTSLTVWLLGAAWLAMLLEPVWRAVMLLALPYRLDRLGALFELVPLVASEVTFRGHLTLWLVTVIGVSFAIWAGRWGIRRAYTGLRNPSLNQIALRLRAWREDRMAVPVLIAVATIVGLLILGQVSARGGYGNEWHGLLGLLVAVVGLGIAALRMVVTWAHQDRMLSRLPVAPRQVATRRMTVLALSCFVFAVVVPPAIERMPGLESPSWAAGHGGARFSRDDAAHLARHGAVPVLRADAQAGELVVRRTSRSPFATPVAPRRDWSPPQQPFLARGPVLWNLLTRLPETMSDLEVGDTIKMAAGTFTVVDLPRDRTAISQFLHGATPSQWGPVPGPQRGFRVAVVLVGGLLVLLVARLCRTVLALHLVAITILWLYVMGVGAGWRFGYQRLMLELSGWGWLLAMLMLVLVGLGLWWHEQARVASGFRRRLLDS